MNTMIRSAALMGAAVLLSVSTSEAQPIGGSLDIALRQPIYHLATYAYGPPPAHAPEDPPCPPPNQIWVLSTPAQRWQVACKAVANRCGSYLSPTRCQKLQTAAQSANLVDADAFAWITSHGYCPILDEDDNGNKVISSICPQGCFSEDTLVSLPDDAGEATIPVSRVATGTQLLSLDDEASLGALSFAPHFVERVVHGPETIPLFAFELASGRTLRVTMQHPMVLSDGRIVAAHAVPENASLLGADGAPVEIVATRRETTTGEVFNAALTSDSNEGHVLVAEGVLVGDLFLQNQVASEQNSIALRK